MDRAQVMIVDDHRVMAEGLVRLLADECDIVDTLSDGRLVLETARRRRPDVIVMDIAMPVMSGLEATRQLKDHGVRSRVIVLTMHADPSLAVEALRSGASGFVLKESSGDELLEAIRAVFNGGTYLARAMTREVVKQMVGVADPRHVDLSERQREVLRLIVRGQRAKEIAASLDLSPRSVEAMKYRMMQLLNVHSTAELVRYAVENGLGAF